MPVITISRQLASLGNETAEAVARRLGFALINRDELLNKFIPDLSEHEKHMLSESAKFYLAERDGETYASLLSRSLHEFAKTDSAVLVGFGGSMMFAGDPSALHVRITAPMETRVTRIRKRFRISQEEAKNTLEKSDRRQARFVRTVFGTDITDALSYDLVLNTGSLSVDECAAAIISLLHERELTLQMRESTGGAVSNITEAPIFKNPAESEFAHLLDMYNIEWKYEPKTFPIEWDAEGERHQGVQPGLLPR